MADFDDWRAEIDALRNKTIRFADLTQEQKDIIYYARFESQKVVTFPELFKYFQSKFNLDIELRTFREWAYKVRDERNQQK